MIATPILFQFALDVSRLLFFVGCFLSPRAFVVCVDRCLCGRVESAWLTPSCHVMMIDHVMAYDISL